MTCPVQAVQMCPVNQCTCLKPVMKLLHGGQSSMLETPKPAGPCTHILRCLQIKFMFVCRSMWSTMQPVLV